MKQTNNWFKFYTNIKNSNPQRKLLNPQKNSIKRKWGCKKTKIKGNRGGK